MKTTQNKPVKGFTLTELLVAVGVIGLVASISIPAVLDGIETSSRRAIFKDTLKAVTEAADALTLQADAPADTYQALFPRFRYLEKDDTAKTITLHSGVILSGFTRTDRCENITVDLNGNVAPNIMGRDQVSITASWEPNNGNACGTAANPITGGMVKPTATVAGNQAFYTVLTR
jgi:prepilin-type N-terminal cleavage/methylation domain-containing protein